MFKVFLIFILFTFSYSADFFRVRDIFGELYYVGSANYYTDNSSYPSNGFLLTLGANLGKKNALFNSSIIVEDYYASLKDKNIGKQYGELNNLDIYYIINLNIKMIEFQIGNGFRFSSENRLISNDDSLRFLYLFYTGLNYRVNSKINIGMTYKLAPLKKNFEQDVRVFIKYFLYKNKLYADVAYMYDSNDKKSVNSNPTYGSSVNIGLGFNFN